MWNNLNFAISYFTVTFIDIILICVRMYNYININIHKSVIIVNTVSGLYSTNNVTQIKTQYIYVSSLSFIFRYKYHSNRI